MMTQPTFRDVEMISAFLDGQLSRADATRLETRLKNEPALRAVFEEMGQTRTLLRKLPARRAPRNFTLTPKMAGIRPPLPRAFPVFRFASVLATILFFFAYMANISAPAMATLRAAAPAPVFGMGGGGNPSEMQSAPAAAAPAAAAQAPALPGSPVIGDAAATPTAELRALAATQAPAATEMASTPGGLAKINPNVQDQVQSIPQQAPVQLPVSPLLLSGLLGLAVLSGGSAYFIRLRSESKWFQDRALRPGKLDARQIGVMILILLALAALAFSIYWLSSTTFYAPVASAGLPQAGLANKGGPASTGAQVFRLSLGMGYSFSATDATGIVTTIDFPTDIFVSEIMVSYIPGLSAQTGGVNQPALTSFSLVPADPGAAPQAPFTVSLDYGANAASGVDENKLALYWWSGSDWQDAAATCSPVSTVEHLIDAHRLRVAVCQMGSFVLVSP